MTIILNTCHSPFLGSAALNFIVNCNVVPHCVMCSYITVQFGFISAFFNIQMITNNHNDNVI